MVIKTPEFSAKGVTANISNIKAMLSILENLLYLPVTLLISLFLFLFSFFDKMTPGGVNSIVLFSSSFNKSKSSEGSNVLL